MMLVDDFSAVLKRKMGLDSGSIGKAAVERAVRHRMQAVDLDDEQEYLMRVQTSPAEMQQLIEAVIVPETWFFRYPESQAAMAALARERLFGTGGVSGPGRAATEGLAAPDTAARMLRVLSVPCSSGEEPYSIAMALLDAGVPASRFQIDAVDISERMVEFARRACYGRNSFRGDDLTYRDRYFTETANGHQLSSQVTARVHFLAGNLFDAHLLQNTVPYDFVFCRNLLIYFDAATQERAVGVLRRFTRRDGILFVGPAETSLMTGRRLPAVPMARAFAFRAEPAAAPVESAAPAALAWTPPPAPRPVTRAQGHAPARETAAVAAGSHWQATAPLGAASAQTPAADQRQPSAAGSQSVDASLREIAVLADQGRVPDAMAQCRAHLERHGASAEALYLLGLLQDAEGDARQAQAAYRKALYLDPTHREALLHLAALIASDGDQEGARRLQARAARQEARRE
ncbi:CheR family methyltransferase [Achromobacter sp. UMC71]|uniref:CheR family methyltransferase n=1 Tax=Achromobacter sp. UMC71 TaxID=1862320 RepID=UPI001600F3E3|nr:CheR family methyltransferase [Achromobacter sp. UMC71]MBB1627905.1 chemotaxis protein CheR [Achromobacter sp. UMC71]